MGRAYVREIQRALAARGYDPGGADGAEGPRTRAAIRAYQKDAGLRETGRASRELLDRLKFSGPARERAASTVEVQGLLAARGYYTGAVDGVAGPATRFGGPPLPEGRRIAGNRARRSRDRRPSQVRRTARRGADPIDSAPLRPRRSSGCLRRAAITRARWTGIAGPATRSAVRRFQRDAGLPVTGVADAGLSRALAN